MQLSGDYIAPRLYSEFYYNKPPLYNWIIVALFELFNSQSEFVARLPTIFSTCIFIYAVYHYTTRFIDRKTGVITSLATLTVGRILFWESMHCLIDTLFSALVFTIFMVLYQYGRALRWRHFFIISYGLAAFGFLLKGLPVLVFLGGSVVFILIWQKSLIQLIRQAHFLAILVFTIIVGSYYLAYLKYGDLNEVFTTLWVESAKRTPAHFTKEETLVNLFTFPFEMLYHFLPWSLFIFFLIRRNVWKKINQDPFIFYCTVTFLIHIPLYWISPQVYPRYVLMLFPLVFTVGYHFFKEDRAKSHIRARISYIVIVIILALVVIVFSVVPVSQIFHKVNFSILKYMIVLAGLSYCLFSFLKTRSEWLLPTVCFLLIMRLGFNFYVLPERNDGYANQCRTGVNRTGREIQDPSPQGVGRYSFLLYQWVLLHEGQTRSNTSI